MGDGGEDARSVSGATPGGESAPAADGPSPSPPATGAIAREPDGGGDPATSPPLDAALASDKNLSAQEPISAPGEDRPRLASYVGMVAAVWLFLAFQAWLLSLMLASAQTIILLSLILAAGFLAVCVFDYLWLRFGRLGD